RNKGVHLLLEAVRGLDARTVIVGFGDYRAELEAMAGRRTLFTGPLEHRHLRHLLPLADVAVVPSIFPEAFRMVAAQPAPSARRAGRGGAAGGGAARAPPPPRAPPLGPRRGRRGPRGRVPAGPPAPRVVRDRRRRGTAIEARRPARAPGGRSRGAPRRGAQGG